MRRAAPAASGEPGVSDQARWLFVGLALLALATILPEVRSANDASRMSLVSALVEHHTLIIDHTPFVTGEDKSWVNGHFYSDKPATPSLIAAAVYWPLNALGIKLGFGVNFAYYLIVLLVSKTSWLAGAVAFYKGLRFVDVPETGRLGATLALAAGSLYLTYNAVFSNHGLAASWVAIGWWAYLRAVHTDAVRSSLVVAGVFLGLAGAADFPVVVYAAGVGLLVLLDGRLRPGVWGYAAAALGALVPGEVVNYLISGSLVPLTLVADYYLWPGSPWKREELTGASHFTGLALVRYGWACLVGARGFLVYNPLVVPAVVFAAGRLAGLRRRRPFAREAAVALGCTAVLWGYYGASSTNFSGYSYSVRWFVPSLPVLLFFLAFGWGLRGTAEAGSAALGWRPVWSWWPALFWVLFAVSAVIGLVGCLNPWSNLGVSQIPFTANLIEHWPGLGDVLPR